MKMVKSLILGSAAGLLAMGGAQAADLPVKAKVVEYVRICSLYGAGFYYIPGTDTCIKIGGYIRAAVNIHRGNRNAPDLSGDGGLRREARSGLFLAARLLAESGSCGSARASRASDAGHRALGIGGRERSGWA